jgi:septal ring factor EnvC (AmiA/AmiB activator)
LVTEEELEARIRAKLEEMVPLARLAHDLAAMNEQLADWNNRLAYVKDRLDKLSEMQRQIKILEMWRKARELKKRGPPKNFREVLNRASQHRPDRDDLGRRTA